MATPDNANGSSSSTAEAEAEAEAASTTSRGWALEKTDATVRIKPRRPYTPYNLFYLLERELVVQGNEPLVAHEKARKKASAASDRLRESVGKRPEDDIPIPARYKGVVLLPYWYEPNLKEKRKHRKTHGKISFKELTGIISKNWASIDAETKDYCTRVSEIGRKKYKETMARWHASQKIIQLKKEHAAMESAREQRMEQFKQTNDRSSPSRIYKVDSNPVTPDRIPSHHHAPVITAPIVTPPNHSSGYNDNRIPMFAPVSCDSHHAFHHYGPPPPLPPPMPHQPHSMHGQFPPSLPHMYLQHQHRQYHQHQQHHQHPRYNYPQPPPMKNLGKHGYGHAYENQAFENQSYESLAGNQRRQTKNQAYKNQAHKNQNKNQANKTQMNQTHKRQSYKGQTHKNQSWTSQAYKPNNGHHQVTRVNGGRGSGNDLLPNLPTRGVDVTVDVKVSVKKDDKSSMTHDEAMRLCTLMGKSDYLGKKNVGSGDHKVLPADSMLRELPSFDLSDHHSLSTEDDELNRNIASSGILNHGNQEDCFLDMIRDELLPFDLGGDESSFPDFASLH